MILHRLPLLLARKARYTLSTQYRVEIPRIFFARRAIVRSLEVHGFELRAEHPVYDSGLRHEIARRLHRQRADTRTLLFARP